MIRNILVAVDYSEASLNALETAIAIARRNEAHIHFLHVAEQDIVHKAGAQSAVPDHLHQVADAMAGSILKKNGIKAEVIFREGFAGAEIVRTGYSKNADLIIMGTHGASGMRETFVGSNAYYVMKNATCPVMIVPEGRRINSFRHILFPLRSSFGTSRRYDYIKAIGSGSDTQVEVFALSVDAVPAEESAWQSIGKKFAGHTSIQPPHLAVHYSNEKNIAREVLERADRMQADLIVLSPTVDMINKQFFIGPFCQRIIHQARVPVLYVR